MKFAMESNDQEFIQKVAEMKKKSNDASSVATPATAPKTTFYQNNSNQREQELVRPILVRRSAKVKDERGAIGAIPDSVKSILAVESSVLNGKDDGVKEGDGTEFTVDAAAEDDDDDEEEGDDDLFDKTRKRIRLEKQEMVQNFRVTEKTWDDSDDDNDANEPSSSSFHHQHRIKQESQHQHEISSIHDNNETGPSSLFKRRKVVSGRKGNGKIQKG